MKKPISCLVQYQIILFVAADNSIKGCHFYVRCGAGRFCDNAISFYLLLQCYCVCLWLYAFSMFVLWCRDCLVVVWLNYHQHLLSCSECVISPTVITLSLPSNLAAQHNTTFRWHCCDVQTCNLPASLCTVDFRIIVQIANGATYIMANDTTP